MRRIQNTFSAIDTNNYYKNLISIMSLYHKLNGYDLRVEVSAYPVTSIYERISERYSGK